MFTFFAVLAIVFALLVLFITNIANDSVTFGYADYFICYSIICTGLALISKLFEPWFQ